MVLEACLAQVEASKEWFASRVLPLSIDQLRWRPDPGQWSIAECLDHLNATFRLWLPRVSVAIALGRSQGCTSDFGTRYEQAEIEAVRLVDPPVRVRCEAPGVLVPAAAVDPEQLVDRFHECRDRYAEAVRRASGLDPARIFMAEPIAPSIHSLGGTLAYMAAHDRRHMWQCERVRGASRFPEAVLRR